MCLDYRIKLADLDAESAYNYKHHVGWKYFLLGPSIALQHPTPKFCFFPYGKSLEVPLDRWILAIPQRVPYLDRYGTYQSGFHIYLKQQSFTRMQRATSKKSLVVEYVVEWQGPIVVGLDAGAPCVVARKLFVPTDPQKFATACYRPRNK